jgi:tight adherence protein B
VVRRAGVFAVALAALLALPAAGSGAVKLSRPDTTDYPVVQLTAVMSAPSRQPPIVRENRAPVAGLQAENLNDEKALAIAVDRSKSMVGQTLLDAKAATRVFLRRKLAEDRIALFSFATGAGALTSFSTSTADAYRALAALSVDKRVGTSLYDVVADACKALARQDYPGRVLVVITDGENVLDTGSPEKAISTARSAGVSIYPIGIAGPQFSPEPLRRLARATGGAYSEARSSADLVNVSNALTTRLERTWRLTYQTTVRPGKTGTLVVRQPGQGKASVRLAVPAGATDASPPKQSALSEFVFHSTLGNLLAAGVVGLFVLIAAMHWLSAWNVKRLRRRLDMHVPTSDEAASSREETRGRLAVFAGLFDATEGALGRFALWRSMRVALERADVPLRPVELFYLMVAAGFLLGVLLTAVAGTPLVLLVGFAIGALVPYVYVKVKALRRLRAFDDQLPDLLMTMAGSLRAGHTFRQAVQAIVDEGQEPASKEFKRVLLETGLGRPVEQALSDMASRLSSKNFDYVISVVAIQREVGGSLASLFDMVADTVRQRQQFLKKVKGLTAMGRMSAYVLIAMPFFVGLIMTGMNPAYMAPLFNTSAGHILLVIGLVGMTIGSLLLRKIVSFRVA